MTSLMDQLQKPTAVITVSVLLIFGIVTSEALPVPEPGNSKCPNVNCVGQPVGKGTCEEIYKKDPCCPTLRCDDGTGHIHEEYGRVETTGENNVQASISKSLNNHGNTNFFGGNVIGVNSFGNPFGNQFGKPPGNSFGGGNSLGEGIVASLGLGLPNLPPIPNLFG